jgi:hypothetical protein
VITRREWRSPDVTGATGGLALDRWNRSETASTRASSSAWSNGLVMMSSAPDSSSPIRSSRLSDCATASTGIDSEAGLPRSSAIIAPMVVVGGTWSMMIRLKPGAWRISSSGSATTVTP